MNASNRILKAACRCWPGFTLIELMICLFIISILLMIALPNLRQVWLTSQRQLAQQSLYKLATLQEEALQRNGQYSATLALNADDAANRSFQIENQIKTREVEGRDYFFIRVTAINAQANDKDCYQFTLDSLNNRFAYRSDGSLNMTCWQ